MDLKQLQRGASVPCDRTTVNDDVPPWLDMEKFRRGQQFYLRHMSVCFLTMHYSLIVGFSIASLLDALVFTNRSDTPSKSIKRYLDTALHVYRWHAGDVWNDPDDPGYKSIRNVRNMHNHVAANMAKKKNPAENGAPTNGDTSPIDANMEKSIENSTEERKTSERVYFSQYDMALVQVGFMGAITMYPTRAGLAFNKSQLEDYIHFWRGIGYLLGVLDEFNICKGNYEETFNICKQIEEHVLLPSLKNPAQHFKPMADAYCKGVNALFALPLYSQEAVTAFVLHNSGRPLLHSLSWKDWLRFAFYKIQVLCFRWIPGLERFLSWRALGRFKIVSEAKTSDREATQKKLTDWIEKQEKKNQ